MSTAIIREEVVLESLECGECQINFAMPQSLLRKVKEDGSYFWCPRGHHIHYFESELDRARAELQRKARELTESKCQEARLRTRVEEAESSLTKHLKRSKNGVCPCCKRTFAQLARHMKTKHPNFAIESVKK